MTLMAGLEIIPMEDSFEEFETPCDFAGESPVCQGQEAEWVMRLRHCCKAVEEGSDIRLACDLCMNARMLSQDGAVECVHCGEMTAPARKAYRKIEAI